jgi:palmitoyltransferase
MDLTDMFNDVIDKFSEKFNLNKSNLQKESLDSNKSNNTSKVFSSYQDEKSTSYEPEESNDLTLVNLLSIKDKGGNTPMLFAAFRGNIKIMEKMISLGVKYDCVNNAGLNIIHMAAQSDSANVIVYFKEKYKINLFKNDDLNNNSLHWACSSGSKSAVDYLLLYINKENNNENIVNAVNSQGQSALHITVLTTGSVSTIKKLIKKNIDINIKDNNGLSVLDLVKENDKYKNLEKIIIEYTHKNCLGLNYHINDKRNQYIKFIMFNILTIFIVSSLTFMFVPFLKREQYNSSTLEYVFYTSTLIFLGFYFYIINSDPGLITKNNNDTWIDIINAGKNINKMCPYCMVEQEKFSKHCFLCHKCIEIFDHHCHWINNCVGHKNKPYFIGFIISLLLTLSVDSFICFIVLITPYTGTTDIFYMDDESFRYFYTLFVLALSLFFIFPVSYLLYMQCKNKDTQKEVQTYYKEVKELQGNIDNDKTEKLLTS